MKHVVTVLCIPIALFILPAVTVWWCWQELALTENTADRFTVYLAVVMFGICQIVLAVYTWGVISGLF